MCPLHSRAHQPTWVDIACLWEGTLPSLCPRVTAGEQVHGFPWLPYTYTPAGAGPPEAQQGGVPGQEPKPPPSPLKVSDQDTSVARPRSSPLSSWHRQHPIPQGRYPTQTVSPSGGQELGLLDPWLTGSVPRLVYCAQGSYSTGAKPPTSHRNSSAAPDSWDCHPLGQ